MKLGVLVIGNGREYLHQTVPHIHENILSPITARMMIDDSGDAQWSTMLAARYPEWVIHSTGHVGMAGAVQAGFDLALRYDVDHVLWLEDDMLLTRPLPIAQAVAVLASRSDLAQMCFKREPFDPSEGDDQLAAIVHLAPHSGTKATYTWHDYLFSLNPCLIPQQILRMGWPSGPIGVGNEDGMTRMLREAGFVFGSWGHVGDPAYARHLGWQRSAAWRL
jgi:hypothetical protein